MTMSATFWGAGLACALGGAVAGTALGSSPMLDRPAYGSLYQLHEQTDQDADARQTPDHYPLVTQRGTIPVAQLSDRGLFSQARYRAYYAVAESTSANVPDTTYDPEADGARWMARNESFTMRDPSPAEEPAVTDAPRPALELSVGPADVTGTGQAKNINVQAVLAMR